MSKFLYLYQYQQENLLHFISASTEAYLNTLKLINSYSSIYLRAFEDAIKEKGGSNGRSTLYETWIKLTGKELQKELKSEHFLSLLSDYTNSLIELHSMYRTTGYPIDYFDRMTDYYRQTFRIPLSIPKELNLAPYDLVYTKGKIRLLHYRRRLSDKAGEGQHLQQQSPPLLVVYAPINQFHILDLNPHRSVVGNLLSNGLDIYLLDWGYPGLEDKNLGLDDYINYVQDAVETIIQQARSEKVSMLGYCWGGIFALIYTALNNNNVKSLALMATPVDFNKDETILGAWSKAIDIDSMMDEFGQMDGQFLDMAFLMRNPPRYALNI